MSSTTTDRSPGRDEQPHDHRAAGEHRLSDKHRLSDGHGPSDDHRLTDEQREAQHRIAERVRHAEARAEAEGEKDESSIKEEVSQAKGRFDRMREKHPTLDHAVRMGQHYGEVNGNGLAGAVTYFGFLSFFPLLALAFFVIGYLSNILPDAQETLTSAISEILPGMIGNREGQISLTDIQDAAAAVGLVGLVGLLYSGLGWLSGMRAALLTVFEQPQKEQPNFIVGKLRDLGTLICVGATLMLSVALSGIVTGFSSELLKLVHLGDELAWLLTVVSVLIGIAASMLLFFVMFKMLARPPIPDRALWSGAMLGAIAFEALKWASSFLIASTKNQPAFQAFGIALILVVWINYFSRVVVAAAAWAHTSQPALEIQAQKAAEEEAAQLRMLRAAMPKAEDESAAGTWFLGGAASMWALVALVRRRRH